MTNPGSPSPRVVNEFHKYDDLNSKPEAHHHSIGRGAQEASPGNHNHDGVNSIALLDGITFTGSKSTQTASVLGQVIAALGALGAKDATLP